MRLRFLTSIGGLSFSFMEGQVVTVPDPLPARFAEWLRQGIVKPERTGDPELALAPTDIERAVTRRRAPVRRAGSRRKTPPGESDDLP